MQQHLPENHCPNPKLAGQTATRTTMQQHFAENHCPNPKLAGQTATRTTMQPVSSRPLDAAGFAQPSHQRPLCGAALGSLATQVAPGSPSASLSEPGGLCPACSLAGADEDGAAAPCAGTAPQRRA